MTETWSQRARAGMRLGAWFAAGYSAYVTVLYVLRGQEPFRALGVTYAQTVLLYLFSGLTAGFIAGVLSRMAHGLLGKIVVGLIAALPASFALSMAVLPPERWERHLVTMGLVGAFIFGPLLGAAWSVKSIW